MGSCSGIISAAGWRVPARCRGYSRACSSESSPRLPWLMLPPSSGNYKLYSVAEEKVISIEKRGGGRASASSDVVGSSNGWVAHLNRDCDYELFVLDPVSGREITLPRMDSVVGWGHATVKKLILSHPPDDEECIAMAIYGYANSLAFCRSPGAAGSSWTQIGDLSYVDSDGEEWARQYQEMTYSASCNLFFCITHTRDLEAWDLSGSDPRLVWGANLNDVQMKITRQEGVQFERYVVYAEESDQLYVVWRHVMEAIDEEGSYVEDGHDASDKDEDDKHPYKTIDFDVVRVDWEEGRARHCHCDGTLDGLSMFLGINHSMALVAPPHLKPDSIYYTDPVTYTPLPHFVDDRKYGGHDIGVFHYPLKTISPCYYPCDIKNLKKIFPSPFWFTPNALARPY